MLKNISERCELVKLYHINCSGPVFLRHTVEVVLVAKAIDRHLHQILWHMYTCEYTGPDLSRSPFYF